MNIRGVDQVILGVDEMDAAQQFLRDFGLNETRDAVPTARPSKRWTVQTSFCATRSDRALPMAVGATHQRSRDRLGRRQCRGAARGSRAELSKDRQVSMGSDGVLRTRDDTGYALAFQVTQAPRV